MTRDEVKEVFKIVTNVYPQFEVTSEKLDVWHRLLKDQDSAGVMKNVERYVLDQKYPPTIADIRERKQPYQTDILAQIWGWEEDATRKQ